MVVVEDAYPDVFDSITVLTLGCAHEHGPADIGSLSEFLRKRLARQYHMDQVRQGETDTKLGRYDVAPLERSDTFSFGCLLHLEAMLVCASEERDLARRVQYAVKARDDVCSDE